MPLGARDIHAATGPIPEVIHFCARFLVQILAGALINYCQFVASERSTFGPPLVMSAYAVAIAVSIIYMIDRKTHWPTEGPESWHECLRSLSRFFLPWISKIVLVASWFHGIAPALREERQIARAERLRP